MTKYRLAFITILPSPYQRDLFGALAEREEINLSVYYMEAASPDTPWPEAPLRSYEQIMPGFWASFGCARAHVNWPLPDMSSADFIVLSSYTSLIGQWLMRRQLRDNAGFSGARSFAGSPTAGEKPKGRCSPR
jgi:hypothetical protein